METLKEFLFQYGVRVKAIHPVHGGDINQAYCVLAENQKLFLKVNDASNYPDMFVREAEGLKALAASFPQRVPLVIGQFVEEGKQCLLLEWLENSRQEKNFWESFGAALAEMHRKPQPYFGWENDNYIGSLAQRNERKESWAEFCGSCRLLPLIDALEKQKQFSPACVEAAERLCKKLGELFPPEEPALLHGDLWSGNFMPVAGGAAIYDPAVYYGHREMDLGMTLLFGGFQKEFYEAYHAVYPLEKNWRSRVELSQLYPLLVHALLFGGGYAASAERIIKKFA